MSDMFGDPDIVSLVGTCSKCGDRYRNDLPTTPTPEDLVNTWARAKAWLASHHAERHPPDSWERLAEDTIGWIMRDSRLAAVPSDLQLRRARLAGAR